LAQREKDIPAFKTVYVEAGNDGNGTEANPYPAVTAALDGIKEAYGVGGWPNNHAGEIVVLGRVTVDFTTDISGAITLKESHYPPIVLRGENGGTVDLIGQNETSRNNAAGTPLITVDGKGAAD
jgi:hypothetical protein